jgi:hypothetical protein
MTTLLLAAENMRWRLECISIDRALHAEDSFSSRRARAPYPMVSVPAPALYVTG